VEAGGGGRLPAFWTVEVDKGRERDQSYALSSGEPDRPEKISRRSGLAVRAGETRFPGWAHRRLRRLADCFQNPFFARVAVNRLWQWHFGEGLQKTPSDFGILGGMPTNPALLDWLAAEFMSRGWSIKVVDRLIVTSAAYRQSSAIDEAKSKIDPQNRLFWA
jgi:hypothetical protein